MIEKKFCIGYLYTQTSQINVFAVSKKFYDESGLTILKMLDISSVIDQDDLGWRGGDK